MNEVNDFWLLRTFNGFNRTGARSADLCFFFFFELCIYQGSVSDDTTKLSPQAG